MESAAMVGSVHERVGNGASSCSGGRGRTEGATGDTTKPSERAARSGVTTRSFRPSPPVRPRGRGRTRRCSVIGDATGRCGRFVNIRFLGPLLAHNCYSHHHKKQKWKIHTPFFERRLSFQHSHPLNNPRAVMTTPTKAIASPL